MTGAVNQVRAKVGEFLGLPSRFTNALRRIDGQPATNKMNTLRQSVIVLQNQYPGLESRVTDVLAKQKQGLSLALITSAVPAAAEVAGMLAAMKKIESALAGVPSPGFSSFASVPMGAALVGVVGLGVVLLARRRKRAR